MVCYVCEAPASLQCPPYGCSRYVCRNHTGYFAGFKYDTDYMYEFLTLEKPAGNMCTNCKAILEQRNEANRKQYHWCHFCDTEHPRYELKKCADCSKRYCKKHGRSIWQGDYWRDYCHQHIPAPPPPKSFWARLFGS